MASDLMMQHIRTNHNWSCLPM